MGESVSAGGVGGIGEVRTEFTADLKLVRQAVSELATIWPWGRLVQLYGVRSNYQGAGLFLIRELASASGSGSASLYVWTQEAEYTASQPPFRFL